MRAQDEQPANRHVNVLWETGARGPQDDERERPFERVRQDSARDDGEDAVSLTWRPRTRRGVVGGPVREAGLGTEGSGVGARWTPYFVDV